MEKPKCISVFLCLASCFFFIESSGAQDWPSRGRDNHHNPVVSTDKIPIDFKSVTRGKPENVKWFAEIGMGYGSEPAIANGLVWVGGNNSEPRDPKITGDAGVLFCFRESDGKFLYQHVSSRRKEGRRLDWPRYGIASTPFIEKDRIYFCTNRCETVCLNIRPLIDGTGLPTEVWKVDMHEKFGVMPGATHIGSRQLHCSPAVWGDYVYVNTTHTVHVYEREEIESSKPKPAPSLICFDKKTGKVKWSDNTPGNSTLGPQWNNPTVIEAGGRNQVIMGQGDGWVRSFDCESGELIWKFDINEKSARLKYGVSNFGGFLRQVISEPVFKNGRLYMVAGCDYEFGAITGRLCCIDPAKSGDLSSELLTTDKKVTSNPNTGLIWEFTGSPSGPKGRDADDENPNVMHGSFGSAAVHKGFVIAVDNFGSVHCLDEKKGERLWSYDTMSCIFGSPLILGNTVIVATEDGEVLTIPLTNKLIEDGIEKIKSSSIYQTSPIYANKTLYLTSSSRIFAIECRDVAAKKGK